MISTSLNKNALAGSRLKGFIKQYQKLSIYTYSHTRRDWKLYFK